MKFLGHRINKGGVSADPERIAAILRYPIPRNCKQLRQFLGVCNFHICFIVGYANYAALLYSLLKLGSKWNTEKHEAFLKLRQCFADSIQLIHPDYDKPCGIYTDASKAGISSILTQVNDAGETLIVSTASRALTKVEKNYTT
jgi:hypothetical protein